MKRFLYLFLPFLFLCACKKELHPEAPEAKKRNLNLKQELSTICIPIEINKKSVEKAVNQNMSGVIYNDDSYKNNDKDDLKLKVTKIAPIKLEMNSRDIGYSVPVRIWTKIRKKFLGQELSESVEFDMTIKFKTTYRINNNWRLITETELVSFNITKKPVISLAGIDIPITPLVEKVLKQYLPIAATAIDDDLKEVFETQKLARELYKEFSVPVDISGEQHTWFYTYPQAFYLSKIVVSDELMKLYIQIDTYANMHVGSRPTIQKASNSIPPLQNVNYASPQINLKIATRIEFDQLSKLVHRTMKGFTYKHKKNHIKVDSISIFPFEERIGIALFFDGSVKGELFMAGIPKYNDLTKSIYIDELDFDLKSKKAALKVAEWLVKGPFKNKVKEQLQISVEDYLVELNDELKNSFEGKPIYDNTYADIKISDFHLKEVFVDGDEILGIVIVKGKAGIEYK